MILDATDAPSITEPLLGALATHYGHGTFIAGVIRQNAPMAQVKMVRVMQSDGVAYESDLLTALRALVSLVTLAQAGGGAGMMVDVISLSLGYFHEDGEVVSDELAAVLDQLTALGVAIVAAAGNFATSRPFYPAAFAPRFASKPGAPLVSVGALNPNGSIALFSDEAPWVTCYATGAAVVSTFPVTSVGAAQPDFSIGQGRRQGLDGDDFASGFAVWSGTSFAAPAVAAALAVTMYRNGSADPALRLDGTGAQAAIRRARAALAGLDG